MLKKLLLVFLVLTFVFAGAGSALAMNLWGFRDADGFSLADRVCIGASCLGGGTTRWSFWM
ncbi:MAG: hypothetical protein ABFD77_00815 [Thermotogota bacterium]